MSKFSAELIDGQHGSGRKIGQVNTFVQAFHDLDLFIHYFENISRLSFCKEFYEGVIKLNRHFGLDLSAG